MNYDEAKKEFFYSLKVFEVVGVDNIKKVRVFAENSKRAICLANFHEVCTPSVSIIDNTPTIRECVSFDYVPMGSIEWYDEALKEWEIDFVMDDSLYVYDEADLLSDDMYL